MNIWWRCDCYSGKIVSYALFNWPVEKAYMSEECKKKSEAASEAKEDEELNESRAFVELTEYIANAVDNDHISLYLPNFL